MTTTDNRPCYACGRTYEEHETSRPAGAPVPKTPCLLLRSGYRPRAERPTPPEDPRVDLDELEQLHREATPETIELEHHGRIAITYRKHEIARARIKFDDASFAAFPELLTLARRAQSLDAEPTEEEVERAAEAMFDEEHGDPGAWVRETTDGDREDTKANYLAMARAALTARRRK